ncbi:MAG: hypothetical protein KZQ99_09970 [Candidatus Thiodiazotropha sp. (ex Dulcina madagascariensis)]|nr:hypothetical protein [Candidatus Thiodiazotropha sp. (ex Dulcina madagascariensis)]
MNADDKEPDVRKVVEELNRKGKNIPVTVSNIPDFPYQEYSDLLEDFKSGEARLLRFAYAMESSLFSMLASSTDKIKSNLGMLLSYGGVLAGIALSFVYSWWFLLIIPVLFFIGSSLTKNAYNNAIFNSAFSSELIFCFLYFTGQVSVDISRLNKQFYFQSE